MSANIRPGTLRAYALGVFTGTLMTATLTMCAAPAKADVTYDEVIEHARAVCVVTARFPSTDGLLGIGRAIVEEGYSGYDAGQLIATSIIDYCPQYIPILRAFVARYGSNQAVA